MLRVDDIASIVLKNGEVILIKATAGEVLSGLLEDEDKFYSTELCVKVNRVIAEHDKAIMVTYKESNELSLGFLNVDEIAAVYNGDYELAKLRDNHLYQEL